MNVFSYMWDFGDGGSTSTLTDPTYTYTVSGTYNVSLYAYDCSGNICDSISQSVTVNCSGSSIEYNSLINSLNVYPNPFNENLFIEFTIEDQLKVELLITDLLGKQIELQDLGELIPGKQIVTWANKNLTEGIYLLHLKTAKGDITKKIMLVR